MLQLFQIYKLYD